MRKVCIMLILVLMAVAASAQQVRLYGHTLRVGKLEPGVMIMVFEGNRFYKKLVTDKKGEFRFTVGDKEYTILFYKPGMLPTSYRILNKMDQDLLKIPVEMEMIPTDESPDSILVHTKIISQSHPEVARAYITAMYEYDRRASHRDTAAAGTRRALVRKAVEERNRFANYKKTTTSKSSKDSSEKTIITVGPDTYEMVVDEKGDKKYYKNQKPVTETTYNFETTRRYEGVLKNKRDVRRFEKYKPEEHVKDKRLKKEGDDKVKPF